MGPVDVNGGVHTAHKQHQRKNVEFARRASHPASCVDWVGGGSVHDNNDINNDKDGMAVSRLISMAQCTLHLCIPIGMSICMAPFTQDAGCIGVGNCFHWNLLSMVVFTQHANWLQHPV